MLGSSVFWTSLLGDAGDTHAKREEKIKKKALARSKGEHTAESLSQGLALGLSDAGAGLWEGVSGMVTRPMEAVNSGEGFTSAPVEATSNFFAGIGIGLVGLGECSGGFRHSVHRRSIFSCPPCAASAHPLTVLRTHLGSHEACHGRD